MIMFSDNIKAVIASGKAEVFYCLLMRNGDGSVYRASTTHYNPVVLGNGVTYVADDYIVGVDPPQMNTTVDREQYKITLADPEFLNGADAEAGLLGKVMEARLCFINPADGTPFTSLVDTFVVYKGRVDAGMFDVNTEELGDSLFNISCASPMANLDQPRPFYISRDYIRGLNANDTSCDAIYEGSGPVIMKWGK